MGDNVHLPDWPALRQLAAGSLKIHELVLKG
jgi:hypothetical protein